MTEPRRVFFFFGSLRDSDIAALVLGRGLSPGDTQDAVLHDYRTVCVPEDTAPVLIADSDARTDGLLMTRLSPTEISRLEFFESVDYSTREVQVRLADGTACHAEVWLDSSYTPESDRPWHYDAWVRQHKIAFMHMTQRYMSYFDSGDVAAAEAAWEKAHLDHLGELATASEED